MTNIDHSCMLSRERQRQCEVVVIFKDNIANKQNIV